MGSMEGDSFESARPALHTVLRELDERDSVAFNCSDWNSIRQTVPDKVRVRRIADCRETRPRFCDRAKAEVRDRRTRSTLSPRKPALTDRQTATHRSSCVWQLLDTMGSFVRLRWSPEAVISNDASKLEDCVLHLLRTALVDSALLFYSQADGPCTRPRTRAFPRLGEVGAMSNNFIDARQRAACSQAVRRLCKMRGLAVSGSTCAAPIQRNAAVFRTMAVSVASGADGSRGPVSLRPSVFLHIGDDGLHLLFAWRLDSLPATVHVGTHALGHARPFLGGMQRRLRRRVTLRAIGRHERRAGRGGVR